MAIDPMRLQEVERIRQYHLTVDANALRLLEQSQSSLEMASPERIAIQEVVSRRQQKNDFAKRHVLQFCSDKGRQLAESECENDIVTILSDLYCSNWRLSPDFAPCMRRWLATSHPNLLDVCFLIGGLESTFDQDLASCVFGLFLEQAESKDWQASELCRNLSDCGYRFYFQINRILHSKTPDIAGNALTLIELVYRSTPYSIEVFADALADFLLETSMAREHREACILTDLFDLQHCSSLERALAREKELDRFDRAQRFDAT